MAKKVRVEMDQLRWAFEQHDDEWEWIFDTETGAVFRLTEEDEPPLPIKQIEDDETGRFLSIEPDDPHEGYRDMEDFITTVREPVLRDLLSIALAGKGPFRRFKDVLVRSPEERQRWFRFQEARLDARIREWLAENDIEPLAG
jgi:Uncharacterised protein family (UPF0158)